MILQLKWKLYLLLYLFVISAARGLQIKTKDTRTMRSWELSYLLLNSHHCWWKSEWRDLGRNVYMRGNVVFDFCQVTDFYKLEHSFKHSGVYKCTLQLFKIYNKGLVISRLFNTETLHDTFGSIRVCVLHAWFSIELSPQSLAKYWYSSGGLGGSCHKLQLEPAISLVWLLDLKNSPHWTPLCLEISHTQCFFQVGCFHSCVQPHPIGFNAKKKKKRLWQFEKCLAVWSLPKRQHGELALHPRLPQQSPKVKGGQEGPTLRSGSRRSRKIGHQHPKQYCTKNNGATTFHIHPLPLPKSNWTGSHPWIQHC